jgi:hypothetical protein
MYYSQPSQPPSKASCLKRETAGRKTASVGNSTTSKTVPA